MSLKMYEATVKHYMHQAGSDYLRYVMRLKWQALANFEASYEVMS